MVPIGAYNVDIMHSRSAEVMAATMYVNGYLGLFEGVLH
jgi:hypothetical protein